MNPDTGHCCRLLCGLHGLIHLMGLVAYWPLAMIKDLPYKTTLLGGKLDVGGAGMQVISLLWLLAGIGIVHELVEHAGRNEGPFGVGYGVAVLFEGGEAGSGGAEPTASATAASHPGQQLPALARRSLEAAFGREVGPSPVPEGYLREPRAVFVTLRSAEGELRGWVGRLTPLTESVAEETWAMARDAAFRDGRFPAVSREELAGLQIEVSVLFPPQPVASPDELDPAVYGVVVRSEDGRRGVLLPGIEEVRTVRQQLAIVRRKAGIAADEPVRLERFRVEKFEEGVRTGA